MTRHALVTLSNTTPVRLTPPGMHSGMDITLQNVNTEAYVFVGGDGLTTTNYGYRVAPNNGIAFELAEFDSIYALSDVDGSQVAVIQVGLEG